MTQQIPQLTPGVPSNPLGAQNLALPGVFQGTSAQQSWNQIQTQIQAEGQAAGLSATQIANNLASAQTQYVAKLQSFITSGITSVQPNLATLAQAAQSATIATTTALGAVNAVQGIAAGIKSGNPQEVEQGPCRSAMERAAIKGSRLRGSPPWAVSSRGRD